MLWKVMKMFCYESVTKMLCYEKYYVMFCKNVMLWRSCKNVMLIFTDGSSNGKATCVINSNGYVVQTIPTVAQIVELQAVIVLRFFGT